MKKLTVQRLAENLLLVVDIFLLFLLLFESKMVFPAWLQSVGRMHPLLLHVPIVVLLLAMGMEFFRFNSTYRSEKFYQDFTTGLFLIGTFSAAVTAVMGVLLSKEEGYTGDAVQWHKWTGVAIVFITSGLYTIRNTKWYSAAAAKVGAVVTTVCLVAAGHLGAGVTHGENFISSPMMAKLAINKVAADKALVYADVVQPIFASKCMSCHNSAKAKGGLLLDNPQDILKGGRDGKLFISAHPENSLVMERINLPEEEKKHMPLSGKPQLSKSEITVLYYWIKSGADFKKKLTDLPETDSLRIAAMKFLAPATDEIYTFAAADEKTVQALGNNYRVIFPIAKESPALVVDFYNKRQFSSKSLEELLPIKDQVIEVNLNKMPVKDADLKILGQFRNLRVLNLNFTDINGEGLSHLSTLDHLKSLSVSGTSVDEKSVSAVTGIKSLRELTVWHTGLKGDDVDQLRKQNKNILFIEGYKNDGPPTQLNTPILVTTRNVFKDTIHLFLKHPIPGAQIRYTLDGSTPDSVHSPVFSSDLVLDRSLVFKARAFKDTWLGSDSIMTHFYKSMYRPDSIIFETTPFDAFKGEHLNSLADGITGDMGFGSGKWVGFQKDMELLLRFKNPVQLSSVGLHLLKNTGADIYPPVSIQVWGGSDKMHMKLLRTISPVASVKGDAPGLFLEECRFAATRVSWVKVVATSVKKSPKWGNSPGKPGWVFSDELLFN